jgi:hypothetical protein
MRKTAVVIAVLMAISSPAFAKAKKAKAMAKPAEMSQGEKDLKLVKGFLPMLLPVGLQAVYFSTHKDQYQ